MHITSQQKLAQLIKNSGKTQAQIARETKLDPAIISRLVAKNDGKTRYLLKILFCLGVKPAEAYRIAMDRRIELSPRDSYERAVYEHSVRAHLSESEYMADLIGFEPWRAFAATYHGIAFTEIDKITKESGIQDVKQLYQLSATDFITIFRKLADRYSYDFASEITAEEPTEDYPPILCMKFTEAHDVKKHLPLKNCDGMVFFGIPHVIISKYTFGAEGEIPEHSHHYGIEFVYAVEGNYEITYSEKRYKILLDADTVYIYDATKAHKINLIKGNPGGLFIIRYCTTKKYLMPKFKEGEDGLKSIL